MSAEIEQTYLALRVILSDEATFHHVCHEVFATIDVNGDKSLEKKEVRNFVDNICLGMGMEEKPDDATIAEVFAELDEDGSNEISLDEMKVFLRKLFSNQLEQIGTALGY